MRPVWALQLNVLLAFRDSASFVHLLCFFGPVFAMPLWVSVYMCLGSPAWKRLTSWLSFVVPYCEFISFPFVSWVRCGA